MGSPEFAVPSLKKIINLENHELIAVYTRKPKKADRGQKLQFTPVHQLAEKNNIKVFTPLNLRNKKDQEELKTLNPDLCVVVAYGLIIPQEVLDIPKYGFINVHPSLLPRWRGSAPIQRCMLSDDKKTGVCIMKLDVGMDTGDIIKISEKIQITKDIDIVYIHDKLSELGADMLIDVIDDISKNDGNIELIKQDNSLSTIADKIEKTDGELDFKNSSIEYIDKQIRTLWCLCGTYFFHNNNRIKIIKADFEKNENINYPISTIIDKNFSIQCKDGVLKPLILQKEGRGVTDLKSFINGYNFNIGDALD